MSTPSGLLARGPWHPARVDVAWSEVEYRPSDDATAAADAAMQSLRERGSPSHDGLAARLQSFTASDERLALTLQPARWSLRLNLADAHGAMAVLCVVRDTSGRWLAGRRAQWLATWPGRWALGAAGAVEIGENPAQTLTRELDEEWSVAPERLSVEALVRLPSQAVMLVGLAWLPAGAEVRRDDEHDDHAWWPADVARWPEEAEEPLRRMATLLAAA